VQAPSGRSVTGTVGRIFSERQSKKNVIEAKPGVLLQAYVRLMKTDIVDQTDSELGKISEHPLSNSRPQEIHRFSNDAALTLRRINSVTLSVD
jgi:hypothetical protein